MNKKSNVKSNVSKMFNVLVVGGTMMAASSALAAESTANPTTNEETCNLELQEKSTNKVLCLDHLKDFELKRLTIDQALNCRSLFCGCWLG